MPAEFEMLYPEVKGAARAVKPGETVEYLLQLSSRPEPGACAGISLAFPERKHRVRVHAELTSPDFERPDGASWRRVDPDLPDLSARMPAWVGWLHDSR